MNVKYIAFMYKDSEESSQYNVIIPDVEGAITYGDDFLHAVEMAKEVLEFSLEDLDSIPIAHELDYFSKEKLKELEIPSNAIPQVVEYITPEKKRITVNFTTKALKTIDDYMRSKGLKNRSAFLEDSALKVALG